jgi:hypothetical protein
MGEQINVLDLEIGSFKLESGMAGGGQSMINVMWARFAFWLTVLQVFGFSGWF